MVEKKAKKTLFCYCHVGGEVVVGAEKSITYKGGRVDGIPIDQDTTLDALVIEVCDRLSIPRTGNVFKYSVKFDKSCLLPMTDDRALTNFLQFNDGAGYVYVEREQAREPVTPAMAATRSSNTEKRSPAVDCYRVNTDLLAGQTSREEGSLHEEASLDLDSADEDPSENNSSDRQPPSPPPEEVLPSRTPISEGWDRKITGVGQEFPDLKAFMDALYKYAIAKKFRCLSHSNVKRMYCAARCAVKGCPWKLSVTPSAARDSVIVSKFKNEHKHSDQDQKKPILNSTLMMDLIGERIRNSPNISPKLIAQELESEFEVKLSYVQSCRLRDKTKEAIFGKVEDTYKLIPWFCQHLMDIMPGSVAAWTSTEDNQFQHLFIAYHFSIRGFQLGCRPLLVINHYKMVNPYEGTLLLVSALDASDELFPLAYGISSSIKDVDWLWFFEKAKSVVGEGEIVVISDYNESMRNVIDEVFGAENHSIGYVHLKENFKTFIRELFKLRGSGKETTPCSLLDDVAHARLGTDYDRALLTMQRYNREVYEWVIASGPEHWANSQFKKKRWDYFNYDPADTFESWMQNDSQVSVFEFMKVHQEKLKELFLHRHKDVETWKFPVSDKIEMKIQENLRTAEGLTVELVSDGVYEFRSPSERTHVVDFLLRSCSCLEWQMTGIPCPHICCVLLKGNLDVYSYVDKCYHKETQKEIYAELMPSLNLSVMPNPEEIPGFDPDKSPQLVSPRVKRKVGRPKQNLVDTSNRKITKRTTQCSLCKQNGHNKKRCKKAR